MAAVARIFLQIYRVIGATDDLLDENGVQLVDENGNNLTT